MIKAAIDIGTNSTRLIIGDVGITSYRTLIREARVTRLGEGVSETEHITPIAIDRTIKVLKIYKAMIESYGSNVPLNIASTSAARDADNVSFFVNEVKKETGYKVNIISAEEEATNAYIGATYGLEPDKNYVVMDIGGGSTELIAGRDDKIIEYFSKDIGCVRLYEMFIKNDPPAEDEVIEVINYVEKIYGEDALSFKQYEAFELIGTAGTVTSLSAIAQDLRKYDVTKVHHSVLTLEKIEEIFNQMLEMTIKERLGFRTMEPGREDIIIAGTAILITLMRLLNKDKVLVSETDILDGLLLRG